MSPPPRLPAPKTTGHLDQLRAMIRGDIPPPPVAQLIGR